MNSDLEHEGCSSAPADSMTRGTGLPTAVRRLQAAMGEISRRIATLERRGSLTPELILEAKTVQASLVPLLRDSRALTAKAEAATGVMRQHEETLSRLAHSVHAMIREMRELLDRASETTAQTLEAERQVRTVLTDLHHKTPSMRGRADSAPSAARKDERPPVSDATRGRSVAKPPVAADVTTWAQRLREARRTLAGLRAITPPSEGGPTKAIGEPEEPAAARLVKSMDELVDAVLPGRSR